MTSKGLALVLPLLLWQAAVAAAPAPAKAQTCAACHGAEGISQLAATPSLAAQPEGFLQWQLVYFRSGTRKSALMQPLAEALSDDDVRELSKYFASLPAPAADTTAPTDAVMYDTGAKLAQQNRCASCHRDDYAGAQAAARTAHQREDYLLKALRDFKAGTRTGGGVAAMADVVYPLDDAQLRALAHFMARLH